MKNLITTYFIATILALTGCGRHYTTWTNTADNTQVTLAQCADANHAFGPGTFQTIENSECDLNGSYCVRPKPEWGTVAINGAVYPTYCLETHK